MQLLATDIILIYLCYTVVSKIRIKKRSTPVYR